MADGKPEDGSKKKTPGGNGDGDAGAPEGAGVDQPQAVHRTGGPYVDPKVAKAEEPGGTGGDGNGDRGPEVVPLDAQGRPTEEPDRLAMPVDVEQPPRLPFVVVGVGASAGGIEAFTEFLHACPADTGMAFVLIIHLPPDRQSLMAEILSKRTGMVVSEVEDGMEVRPDHVYVIRPGRTLLMRDGRLRLTQPLTKRGHGHPVDDFFRSLAAEQRERAVAVVLSGMGSNGAVGAQAVKAVGGVCVAQEPESAQFASMPRHLIEQGHADYVLRPRDIPEVLMRFAGHAYVRGATAADEEAAAAAVRDQQDFADLLAILRTRTRQDFAGYKRATVVRRTQRRMGLTQTTRLAEYVRLLRTNPTEVQALADDLLIHVTGFFRDPAAWEALRDRVIDPLVRERDLDVPIRCWVTACSSGEEAYTLAILIAEAMERHDRRFEVKVFATDMAERSLAHARAAAFPLGIEGEVTAERLERFFERDDAVYRVRKEIREMVVFAPQNVLTDPPFSRLDICTCRNLLIYLEPEVQGRVLSLIHFGLRDGGALFLGTSETVGGADDLFEPIDKKWRLYRRVGATRHGPVDFPAPVRLLGLTGEGGGAGGAGPGAVAGGDVRPLQRPTVALLTERALLQRYTPAAVVIDRDLRVFYFHGPTERYLTQPAGEPTRELMSLARESVRGAVRTAVAAAVDGNGFGEARDGQVTTEEGVRRVWVSVAPLEVRAGVSAAAAVRGVGYLLVTFEERPDEVAAAAAALTIPGDLTGAPAQVLQLSDELARVRDELQSTIEELQASNEELKAANEEVTSVNEELQSTNEELETSKEELQSLNEELTTVNAQLEAKNDELQGTSNDLQSLLSSTEIGVIFLDPQMRIRRYTPAVRELFELISSDVGRPLSDLHRKFEDERLMADARAVLERLVPLSAEVRTAGAEGGVGAREGARWYERRITPYRTGDNRIDGVVITFVDVTQRRRAEAAVGEARAYAESIVETLHEPLLVLNADLTVRSANRAFYRHFRVTPGETRGRKIYELGNGQWDIPALREALEEVLPTNRAFDDYEVVHAFEEIGRRVMLLNGRRLDDAQLILLGIRDVTDRHDAADAVARGQRAALEALAGSDVQFRGLVEGVQDFAIFLLDKAGRITLWNRGAEQIMGWTAAEAVGQPGAMIFTPEDRAAGEVEKEIGTARREGRAPNIRWHLKKDGSRFFGNGVLTRLDGPDGGFVKIMRDETDRKRTEDELARVRQEAIEARGAAELANRTKDEFLATASHELRTPLSAILIWSKTLRRGIEGKELDREAVAEAVGAIEHSAVAQRRLIEDLMDTVRIEAGKLRLDLREADLSKTVGAAVEAMRPAAAEKGVTLAAELAEDVGRARIDAGRIEQVVWNLISNAVKFTPAGGRVEVSLRKAGGGAAEVRVSDNGIGIEAEHLQRIFERFTQVEGGLVRAAGGLGLGLTIARQLVDLHGGTIEAQSGGRNQGATFTVRLPAGGRKKK